MMTTRSEGDPIQPDTPRLGSCRGLFLVMLALLLATLACTRSDVPLQDAVGSGSLPSPTSQVDHDVSEANPTETVEVVVPTVKVEAPEPVVTPTFPPTATAETDEEPETLVYEAQPGDSLHSVSVRFGVVPEDITSTEPLSNVKGLINPGQWLFIPDRLANTGPNERIIPDSEVIFSPHAVEFDVPAFAAQYGGYLTRYRESLGAPWRPGPEVLAIAARDNSVNPRLLLALLEFEAGWVTGSTAPVGDEFSYPMGHIAEQSPGLFRQLGWAANELGNGYYGWRAGTITELTFSDETKLRLAPDLNAGTVAIQYYLSRGRTQLAWEAALEAFIDIYVDFFGDPWAYEHPLYEYGVEQPELILPFLRGQIWAFTGGPHGAWERDSAWAALDFAPASLESGCVKSDSWVLAAAPGYIIRSDEGVVVLDMDGDGREQTGWVLLYLHIGSDDRIQAGTYVETGDFIGHPSCEGGSATGTHVHLARKYNGEWILADSPLPFVMSGWVPVAGAEAYQGALVKDDQIVLACPCASYETLIKR
jgi:LysM repeat protein